MPAGPSPTATTDWRTYGPVPWSPLLQAAVAAFNDHGFHGASVRDIAARAGVTMPTLYYHHGDKQGLLVDALEASMHELLPRFEQAVAEAGDDPIHRFEHAVECSVLFLVHRQQIAWLASQRRYVDPARTRRYTEMRRQVEDRLRSLVDEGVAAGRFRVGRVEDVVRALLGMYQAIADWYVPEGPLAPADIAERYVHMSLRLVGAPGNG